MPTPADGCGHGTRKRGRVGRGVALLEIIFALALFTAGAVTVLTGIDASVRAADRLRTAAVAENLAVSLLSEVQIGLVPAEDEGPTEYEEPYEGWTWQVVTSDLPETLADGPQMKTVEIVIARPADQYTHRLSYLAPGEEQNPAQDEEADIE